MYVSCTQATENNGVDECYNALFCCISIEWDFVQCAPYVLDIDNAKVKTNGKLHGIGHHQWILGRAAQKTKRIYINKRIKTISFRLLT